VAVGVALDTLYSARAGIAPDSLIERVFPVLRKLRFTIHHPALDSRAADGRRELLGGLDEFREHLGGRLTLLMLCDVGRGIDVHDVDLPLMERCIDELRSMSSAWGG
jgi:3-dehydroquinate synthase